MVRIGNRRIELSNENKVLFPAAGITKGEVVSYYRRIAKVMLPHLRDRPVSLQRFPDGIDADGFFQKNTPDYFPSWFRSVRLSKQDGSVDYPVADTAASLVYLANQGTITLHAALARTARPRHPDRLVFDLDPPGDEFEPVQNAARRLRKALDELDLPSFVQTTGSRGLHVVVPLQGKQSFDRTREFALDLARELAQGFPGEMTVEQRKHKRGDRVFLDCLRNAYGQTAVAPYSLRARPGAPCATPLTWREALASDMRADRYGMKNIFRRLARTDDPWRGIGRHAAVLPRARG